MVIIRPILISRLSWLQSDTSASKYIKGSIQGKWGIIQLTIQANNMKPTIPQNTAMTVSVQNLQVSREGGWDVITLPP